jgi:ATP-dependent DNA helicase PIF1
MRQSQALAVMKRGDNVFLTGPAGSGKTFILNKFILWAKRQHKTVAITASTGIAATHIGGSTIHSWSGLGIKDSLSERDIVWLKGNDKLKKRYNGTDVLVIDEVSMLHGARLDMIDSACRILREDDRSFGGMQVVLVGDLFQLPPVNRGVGADDFVHMSESWERLAPTICYLNEQHRQKDGGLLDVLNAMRDGSIDEYHIEVLGKSMNRQVPTDQVITKLHAHNMDVDSVNSAKLKSLDGDEKSYIMQTNGVKSKVEQLLRGVLAPETLVLKPGAEVMFVANNFGKGFANGTRGLVTDISKEGPVVVLYDSGKKLVVEPHTWILEEDGRKRAEVVQLPLRLAWAITIHKSQGMSLDAAEMDLSRSFTPGMGYVALSRVRSVEGLYLKGINETALRLHPLIHEFDRELRSMSSANATKIDLQHAPVEEKPDVDIGQALYGELAAWRLKEANTKKIPAYRVASNKTLQSISIRTPQTIQQLLATSGVGQKFIDDYGTSVLQIINQSFETTPS